MNWIGGARQRVSLQGEKKLQKEFFERQKLKKHNPCDLSYHGRKNSKNQTISQDIAALQTVNRFSPNFSCLGVEDGQVKKVDLKGYKSTVVKENRVQEVELPHSPINIPSSLHLTDSTSIKVENPQWEDTFKEKTKIHEPKSLFSYHVKQNEVPVKKRPQTCLSEYSSTVAPNICNKRMKLPVDDWGVSSQTVERTDRSDKDRFQMNNPWASEDFQMIPLNGYNAKYEDMIPWKVNGDFNKKSLKMDINSREWSQETSAHYKNFPKLSPESSHTKNKYSSRLNPIKPRDNYLEESFSRNCQKIDYSKSSEAIKNQYSKLDSFDDNYSFHSSKKTPHKYNLDQIMFSNHIIKSGTSNDLSYLGYEPDSESTPFSKYIHNQRTGSHSTLEEIKSDFIRKHGDMNSLLDDHHYKMPPRIGNIPVESSLFHPKNYHGKNQIAVDETPFCENPPSFFHKHNTVRKSLTPLFDSTQQMTALTPNELSFVKMLSQDQVMASFDEESNKGLQDGGTPDFREKVKNWKSADKSKEMNEVLAELSQLQHENDKDNMENVSQKQKISDSSSLVENDKRTTETEVFAEMQLLNKNISKSDTQTSNEVLFDINNTPTFNLSEYSQTHCTAKENLPQHHSTSTSKDDMHANNDTCTSKDLPSNNNTCISKDKLSEHKVPSTSTVDLSVNGKISETTLYHSPILLSDSFETQDVTNRLNRSIEDSKSNSTFPVESFDLQADTRKEQKNTDVPTQSDVCSSEQTFQPLRQKENIFDVTRGLESKVADADSTKSCHLHLQPRDIPHRQQVDQATQTEVSTIEVALSPIFTKSSSISVGTQWQSLECYSPKFSQGCVELCEDESNGTQLHTHCNVEDVEKFSTECLLSTQDSLIDNSDSSQAQSFYSLRSRQKCLQS